MLREGSGEPLVLIHPLLASERIWREVLPLLSPSHDVIAPTMVGHRGGRDAPPHPIGVADLVDDLESTLDELDLRAAHVAGVSTGGWVALELARRGRAVTACAFSPTGAWVPDSPTHAETVRLTLDLISDVHSTAPLRPLLAVSKRLRRIGLRMSAVDGGRVRYRDLKALTDDLMACEVGEVLVAGADSIAPLDPPCPVTIAWSREDRVCLLDTDGRLIRELVPAARHLVLDGVGHFALLDDPGLVAATILETTALASAARPVTPTRPSAAP